MANETTEQLREMAAHRGLKLVSSRRRKPGGDFGRYGLRDAAGAPVFGLAQDRPAASPEEVEAYLRGATSAAWAKSAGATKSAPRRKAKVDPEPKPRAAPKPAPRKPRFKVAVGNLLARLPAARRAEAFTQLLARPGVRVERIVSRGQATPPDQPMVQASDEWVLLLQGAAGLRIEDSDEVALQPGDHVWIAAGQKHWVTWTAKDRPSVWLAIHFDEER